MVQCIAEKSLNPVATELTWRQADAMNDEEGYIGTSRALVQIRRDYLLGKSNDTEFVDFRHRYGAFNRCQVWPFDTSVPGM